MLLSHPCSLLDSNPPKRYEHRFFSRVYNKVVFLAESELIIYLQKEESHKYQCCLSATKIGILIYSREMSRVRWQTPTSSFSAELFFKTRMATDTRGIASYVYVLKRNWIITQLGTLRSSPQIRGS
jgi:hypothetical protein